MNYRKQITRLIALALFVVGSSCFKKPKGVGEETTLFVIADSTNWVVLEPALKEVFEKTIITPQPEKVFEVHWVPPRKFNNFAKRKNLVIAGSLRSRGKIDTTVANMLAPDVKARVEGGTAFYFPKDNPWAHGQLLMVLACNSLEELQENLRQNKELLYDQFKSRLLSETRSKMYERLEQRDLADKLLKEYGWTLRIQHDYEINTERPQDRFIMLRRSLPGRERWLFVHWIEDADPSVLDGRWAVSTRNRLTKKFYEVDLINEDYTNEREVDFLGRSALLLEGLWDNEEKMAGGPFRNYTFYDESSGRIYMIDVAVFFPGGEKEPFLRQLDIMAHTFKTASDVANEKEEAS